MKYLNNYIYLVLFIAFLSSCGKTTEEVEIGPTIHYSVQTLTGFDNIDGFDPKDIRSMVFDSKDNLYFTTDASSKVFKMSADGSMTVLPKSSDEIFKYDSPHRLFVGANDELCIVGLYQKADVLYFSYKEGGEIEPIPNPLRQEGDFYSFISFLTADASSNNILGYNTEVYRQDGKNWLKISEEVELNGVQLEGNVFASGGGRSYYKLSGFEGIFNDAVLAYLDKDFQKHYLQSENFSFGDETTSNFGDGLVPNVFVGNVSLLASDPLGNLYFLDQFKLTGRIRLRSLSLDGQLTTLAGGILADSNTDGVGPDVSFEYPSAMAVNSNGDVYIGTPDGLRLATVSSSN